MFFAIWRMIFFVENSCDGVQGWKEDRVGETRTFYLNVLLHKPKGEALTALTIIQQITQNTNQHIIPAPETSSSCGSSSQSVSPCFPFPGGFYPVQDNYWNETQVFIICTWPNYSSLLACLLSLSPSADLAEPRPLATTAKHKNTTLAGFSQRGSHMSHSRFL